MFIVDNITELPENFSFELWEELLQSIEQRSHSFQLYFRIAMIFIFIVGVIGNLLTCVVIYLDKSMHTATNYYLFNLAISDLIVAFGIWPEVTGYSNGHYKIENYELGDIVCKTHFFLVVGLWNNGILTMTVLAIERYIAIWQPLWLKSTPVWRRVMKIMALIWTVAILETLPEAWTIKLIYTQNSTVCFIVPTPFARIVNGVLALVSFIIPLTITIFVYTMIAFKVNISQQSNASDKIFNHRNNSKKINKLIVALTLSFLICWVPFFTMRVIIFACSSRQFVWLAQWWDLWLQIVSLNSWFSIVLNPMLFSLMSTKFREALKTLWYTKILRRNTIEQNRTVAVA